VQIHPVGYVRRLSEGEFLIELSPSYVEGLHGIAAGERLDVLYWMHKLGREKRRTLKVHPRGDTSRPLKGVFGVRSPMRPNPIGVSSVSVVRIEGPKLFVTPFDAQDGSPVIDLKASPRRP